MTQKRQPWSVADAQGNPGNLTYSTRDEALAFVADSLEFGGTDHLAIHRRGDDGWRLYREYRGTPLPPEVGELVGATADALGDEWTSFTDGAPPPGAWWSPQNGGLTAWLASERTGHLVAVVRSRQPHQASVTIHRPVDQPHPGLTQDSIPSGNFLFDLRSLPTPDGLADAIRRMLSDPPPLAILWESERTARTTSVSAAGDVTGEMIALHLDIVEFWFPRGDPISWTLVWDMANGLELRDGSRLSVDGTSAQRKIEREVSKAFRADPEEPTP